MLRARIPARGTRAAVVRVRRVNCVCAAARTHPRHPVCTRPCCSASRKRARVRARIEALCACPGARVRPHSDLEPPRSSRELLPLFTSIPPPHALYLPPLSSLPQFLSLSLFLSLSFSLFHLRSLTPTPSLSLSFAPSATQLAMDSRHVRNWLTESVEFFWLLWEEFDIARRILCGFGVWACLMRLGLYRRFGVGGGLMYCRNMIGQVFGGLDPLARLN